MGRSGIRHRKPPHHLPKVHGDVSPEDMNRLFGRFQWSAYSPAGTVERIGFFARQAARLARDPRQTQTKRRAAAFAHWYLVLLFALPVVGVLVALVKAG